jgi:VIT1/CCC1 family predicted Fe2+/Mn2+ transporter
MADAVVEGRKGVLDPIERWSEIIFGLLMAMAITGSLSVASSGKEEVHTMMIAALGCNIAWGLADGIMYLVGTLTERTRRATLIARLKETANPKEACAVIADELPERLAGNASPQLLEDLRQSLVTMPPASLDPGLRRDDWVAALGVFLMVVISTFPVVIPFALVDELKLAMRLSNATGVVVLFVGGWMLARYAGGNPWKGGAAMAGVGAVLSAAIIALGG